MKSGDITWDEFKTLIPSLIGGFVVADDSSAYLHVGVIDKIFEGPEANYLQVLPVPGTVRAIMSDDVSNPDHSGRFDAGWGANMNYASVSDSDGVLIYSIPELGRVFLYPPGHPEIREHWLPRQTA